MRRIIYFALALLLTSSLHALTPFDLHQVVDGSFSPEGLYGVYPLKDGDSFARIIDGKRIVKYSFKTGAELGNIFDASTARGKKLSYIEGYIMSPDESRILIQTGTRSIYRRSFTAEYYIYTVANNTLEPLSKNGPQEQPLFSPDGNQIAFVRNNNLFLVKLLFNNSESQVTTDGKYNEIINGKPDWVNEEEFEFARAFDFSADSKMLAWIRYDESKVPLYEIPMYKGMAPEKSEYATYPGNYSYKYPVAGAVNSTVSVCTYDIKSHVTRKMDVPMDADGYIPRIKFTDTPDQLAIVTLNRHQSVMNLYLCNARSRICKLSLSEKDERYVKEDAYQNLQFYGDHFIMTSDRSGTRQLYWYTLTGQLEKQLTSGAFEVTEFYGYDAKAGTFFYCAEDGSPLRTAIFRTDLKGKMKKLSTESGTNSAIFSGNMKYYINVYSNLTTPPVTAICNDEGKTEKVLITNQALRDRLSTMAIAKKEFFTFTTSEGIQLNGWMMKPVDFDANKKYPVVLYQYSGPGSQQVKDEWGLGFVGGGIYESYMAQKGIIFACVDGRGTGGRGADFEKCTYQHLGKYESRDQVETALYLGTLSYVDKDRIGIWGWSYGGFNTLMSMSEGRPVFAAGVAVAPPTSYRYYDSIYTERYMRTPGENPDGYDDNAMTRASKLHGDLLICHGSADDNVHFRNTAEYTESLVQANKQFEMQVYTNRNHGISGGNTHFHLTTRMSEFFIHHLCTK